MNNNNRSDFKVDFANAVGMLAARFSLNPTVGQIYGLLYMSPEPVSLNEMVDKLGISKGAVSTNVRVLESWGAVRKVWVDNTRKDYYEANTETLTIIVRRIKDGITKRLEEAKQQIGSLESGLNKSPQENMNKDNLSFYSKRVKQVKEMQEQVKLLLDMMPKDEDNHE
ncbi:GbsR/MarR family transcriptional regulator [Elusimicrobiota bacterium]